MTCRVPLRRRDAASERGLTLLEMLIVLAVIAVAAGATVLTFAPQHGAGAELEAHRLTSTIQVAADASIVSGRPALLMLEPKAYRIVGGARYTLADVTTQIDVPAQQMPLDVTNDRPFAVRLNSARDRWRIAFDGLRATAAADPK